MYSRMRVPVLLQRPGTEVLCSPLPISALFHSLPEPSLMFLGWAGSHPPASGPYSSGYSGVRLCPAHGVGAGILAWGVMAAELSHSSSPSLIIERLSTESMLGRTQSLERLYC